ncbi:CLUMA_CG020443, isoform A [Clunio marinus]|uniref:CLUMA_CG020443, isoform A n=1 Tax=Clunio marinus TaxID=568069 RepID=A0A1J1J4Z0_9DIPT|nr:CLUMA_CG020443, isoform A [Clunio marinus]
MIMFHHQHLILDNVTLFYNLSSTSICVMNHTSTHFLKIAPINDDSLSTENNKIEGIPRK